MFMGTEPAKARTFLFTAKIEDREEEEAVFMKNIQ